MLAVYVDASVQPTNPGHGGYGVSVERDGEEVIVRQGYLGAEVSNNQCEYVALLVGLYELSELALDDQLKADEEVHVYSDSALVVNQVNGTWIVNAAKLRPLWNQARTFITDFEAHGIKVVIQHVAGHAGIPGNERADQLADLAVLERMPDSSGFNVLLGQGIAQDTVKRGHEVLVDIIQDVLQRHSILVTPTPVVTDPGVRKALHTRNTLSSRILLRAPHLLAVSEQEGPTFITASTSFIREDGRGVRVISRDMWDALVAYQNSGHRAYVAHRPYAQGKWVATDDLGWDRMLGGVQVSRLSNLRAFPVDTPVGWAPIYKLQGTSWQSLLSWAQEREGSHAR